MIWSLQEEDSSLLSSLLLSWLHHFTVQYCLFFYQVIGFHSGSYFLLNSLASYGDRICDLLRLPSLGDVRSALKNNCLIRRFSLMKCQDIQIIPRKLLISALHRKILSKILLKKIHVFLQNTDMKQVLSPMPFVGLEVNCIFAFVWSHGNRKKDTSFSFFLQASTSVHHIFSI